MQAKTVKEVMIAARWIIDNFGWCQGSFYKGKNGERVYRDMLHDKEQLGCCCLVGALRLVEADHDIYNQTVFNLCVQNKVVPLGTNLTTWNDEPGRTKEQVIKLLDKAIEKA